MRRCDNETLILKPEDVAVKCENIAVGTWEGMPMCKTCIDNLAKFSRAIGTPLEYSEIRYFN